MTDEVQAPPAVSRSKWMVATVVGVVVSVAASIAIGASLRIPTASSVWLGLIVGVIATGVVAGAKGWRGWVTALLLTFLGQVVLGVVVFVATRPGAPA